MTLSKSLITGHLNDATQIRFTLSAWDSELAEIVLSQSQTFDLVDGDIPGTCLIWQNQAGLRGTSHTVTAIKKGADGFGVLEELGSIQVPEGASHALADLLEASSVITPGNTYNVLTDAEIEAFETDRQAAQTAAAAAEADRILAENAAAYAQASALTCATWVVLSGLTGATAGTGAEVLDADTGSHTDPVVGGSVANAGRYSWSTSPAGWRRIGATGLTGEAVRRTAADAQNAGQGAATTVQAGGQLVLVADDGGPLDSIDLLHGDRLVENLRLPGGEMAVRNGCMPLLRNSAGESALEYNLLDARFETPAPMVGFDPMPAQYGVRPTMRDDAGNIFAGYSGGEYIRLHPARHGGLIIRGDHNRIPQLWWSEDISRDIQQNLRQITFSQHGVHGYRWVKLPTPTEDGEVILMHGDTDLIRDRRHVTRRAKIPRHARSGPPSKVLFMAVNGQSKSVGAGTNSSPSRVEGPQTIRTSLPMQPVDGVASPWTHELMTFVGGTLPHQATVDNSSRTIPIDPAKLASLVPMVEGLGGTADTQGGSRESYCSAMALHLAGPNGYDGSAYVISASFGFGGTPWQELFLDDAGVRQQAYLNLLMAVQKAKDFATSKGLPLEVHMVADQGESNANDGRSNYASRITTFLPVMQADITAISGQAAAPQLFLAQTTYTKGSANAPCDSALGQLDAAMASADIHILPPDYWADYENDTVHMKAPENQLKGALFGEVISDWLIRGEEAALHMTVATWSGPTLTMQMNHPFEMDAITMVGLDKSLGFSHTNSGGAAASVSVVQPDATDPTKLIVTCSSSITSGTTEEARIAHSNALSPLPVTGHASGLRSGFRRSDWQRYSLIDGRPLAIFANLQSLAATEV